MQVDFGRAARDYAKYRAGFPDRFYDALAAHGIQPRPGADRALDIATGTGTIARSLAQRGWRACGVDRSAEMLTAARMLDQELGVATVYQAAKAEALPFRDSAFALATAGTCWHWFDRAQAAREAWRVLPPGAHLVIASLEWRERPGNAVEATTRLIATHNPAWASGFDIHAFVFTLDWADDLVDAGFTTAATLAFEFDIPYTHHAWRGRIRASAGVGASLSAAGVARFDAELAELLAREFPDDPIALPHEVMAIIARRA